MSTINSVSSPASAGQERLWFLSEQAGDSPVYNVPLAYVIEGLLDTDALAAAFVALRDRHEILRTRLVATADGLIQQIDPVGMGPEITSEVPVAQVDTDAIVDQEARTPIEATDGYLWRAHLLNLAQ